MLIQILTTIIGLQLSIYTCAATAVHSQTTVATTIPFTEFLKAYPEIERYLVQNVHSDDIGDNMNKARELLQLELSQEPTTTRLALIDALQTFVSLADDQHEQSCDFKRYITLYYNYVASRSRQTTMISSSSSSVTLSSSTNSLRVARIVDQFALRHAQLCTDFYGAQVRERYNELSAGDQLESIEGLLDSALRSSTGPNMVEDLVQHFQHQNAPVLGTSNGPLIYSILAKQSSSDPDSSHLSGSSCDDDDDDDDRQQVNGDLVIDKEKYEAIERLFEKHIRQPCKNLVNLLRDVMEPAAFDVLYHPKRQDDSFYIIWARYKLCDTMSTQVRQKLLTNLVQIACDSPTDL